MISISNYLIISILISITFEHFFKPVLCVGIFNVLFLSNKIEKYIIMIQFGVIARSFSNSSVVQSAIKNVTVIGGGLMGSGIAQVIRKKIKEVY